MIHAHSLPANFQVAFTNGRQTAISDTTLEKGGSGEGFHPHELLEAALASCMTMTLRMCAAKHSIALKEATVTVPLNRDNPGEALFEYHVTLQGELSKEQKEQLLAALEHCPVRETLSKSLTFGRNSGF